MSVDLIEFALPFPVEPWMLVGATMVVPNQLYDFGFFQVHIGGHVFVKDVTQFAAAMLHLLGDPKILDMTIRFNESIPFKLIKEKISDAVANPSQQSMHVNRTAMVAFYENYVLIRRVKSLNEAREIFKAMKNELL